jgi:hypothetical protein
MLRAQEEVAMRNILACGIAGALLLGTPSKGRCGGSDVDVEDVGFAAAGLGFGSQGVAGVLSLNFSHRDFFYGARASTTTEFNIFGPRPDQSDTDYAVLVGRCVRTRNGFASAASGIGLTQSVRRGRPISPGGWFDLGDYERIDRTAVGLPVDLKATLHAGSFGLGVNVFAELRPHGSFAGVVLMLQAGKLR